MFGSAQQGAGCPLVVILSRQRKIQRWETNALFVALDTSVTSCTPQCWRCWFAELLRWSAVGARSGSSGDIRATYGAGVTVPRVLGFVLVRLLAEGMRYLVQELWKDLLRRW
ncbi:hypothetical protein SAMN04488074_101345 [Lentzea albidocapillata subsp. violacea]|uniref:Uncharacterized protein n=1 Tax=Lentzea albidocapillata subsp. violacea TaxID=128104 RepID=A0A1G8QGH4_9PSEU|nr:hypothetical protein SAMN04488074_101345 [Lentzea albidocapillata subsp. violacea]